MGRVAVCARAFGFRRALDLRLYLVLDPSLVRFRSVEVILHEAVAGGVTVVQVREKKCSNGEFLQLARRASAILKGLGVPLIVNDRVDVALDVCAAGVHVGQGDLHWTEVRRLVGENAIVGVSVETLAQASNLAASDCDYFGVSSMFPTRSKKDTRNFWGLAGLRQLRMATGRRLVAIGGVDSANAEQVVAAGADGIAVISALCGSANPRLEARRLRTLVDGALSIRKTGEQT